MTMNLAHHSNRETDPGREGDNLSIELFEIKNKVDNLSRPDDTYLRNGLSID